MADRDRDEQGRYSSEAAPEDVLAAMEPMEPYGTREIADAVGIPRRTAYQYLDELADAGELRKKKTDARRAIWIKSE
jgi:DNA-binding IclR family transcriptional regulator